MKLALTAGTTSQIIHVFIQDATVTTGAGKTGLAYGDMTGYCVRAGGVLTALTMETIATLGTWASTGDNYLGFRKLDDTNAPGLYELHLPNNLLVTDPQVVVMLRVAGAVPCLLEIQLVSVPADMRKIDGENLISHPAGMVPGADTMLVGTAAAGSATTITLTGGVATTGYYNGCLVAITSGTGAGQARTILSYVGGTAVATVTRNWVTPPNATSKFAVVGFDVPALLESGTAQGGTSGTITLDLDASGTNDVYNDNCIFISAGTGVGQSRQISDYTGDTKVANVTPAWAVIPDATSVYQIVCQGRVDVGRWLGTVPLTLSAQKVQAVTDMPPTNITVEATVSS